MRIHKPYPEPSAFDNALVLFVLMATVGQPGFIKIHIVFTNKAAKEAYTSKEVHNKDIPEMITILTSTNDPHLIRSLQDNLDHQGIHLVVVADYHTIQEILVHQHLDGLVIDVTPYPQDMEQICQTIRHMPSLAETPLLLITPELDASQIAQVLDAGTDDVLRKPFAEQELLARLRALLRWHQAPSQQTAQLVLDVTRHRVQVNDREINLTPIEFQLLYFLCNNRDRYLNAQQILESMWPPNSISGDTALVRNHIRNLRRKLEKDADRPQILISRYGQGYLIRALVQQS